MSFVEKHPHARWAVPVTVLALVGGGAALGSAQADPGLPAKSAEQLLVDLQKADERSFSGTVSTHVDLGLPQLPGTGHGRATTFENLAAGSNTVRVWVDGKDRQRLAVLGDGGEAVMVRNDRTVWLWNAQQQTATRATLPDKGTHAQATKDGQRGGDAHQDLPATPQEAARYVLERLNPSTRVTTNGSATVAGRPAYQLLLTPRAADTLVRQVAIDVDSETSMPLRVRVTSAATGDAAIDVGYTSLDLSTPEASVFAFTPPPGATVKTEGAPEHGSHGDKATPSTSTKSKADKPQVVGTGWSAVTVQRLPKEAMDALLKPAPAGDPQRANATADMLHSLPVTSGDWGSGRVVEGTLFSAVLTDDGRLAVGAVSADRLYAALKTTATR